MLSCEMVSHLLLQMECMREKRWQIILLQKETVCLEVTVQRSLIFRFWSNTSTRGKACRSKSIQ